MDAIPKATTINNQKNGGFTWAGMKDKILTDLWSTIKQQGFSTLVLVAVIAFFYCTYEKHVAELKALHEMHYTMLKEDRAKLLEALNRNTTAFESFKKTK